MGGVVVYVTAANKDSARHGVRIITYLGVSELSTSKLPFPGIALRKEKAPCLATLPARAHALHYAQRGRAGSATYVHKRIVNVG